MCSVEFVIHCLGSLLHTPMYRCSRTSRSTPLPQLLVYNLTWFLRGSCTEPLRNQHQWQCNSHSIEENAKFAISMHRHTLSPFCMHVTYMLCITIYSVGLVYQFVGIASFMNLKEKDVTGSKATSHSFVLCLLSVWVWACFWHVCMCECVPGFACVRVYSHLWMWVFA